MTSKLFAGLLLLPLLAHSAEQSITQTPLFTAGEGGYKLYRIPGMVVTAKGSVLVYSEARKFTGSDWDTIDTVLRRSTDGGATFSAPVSIAHVAGTIVRNPVAIERKQGKETDVTYNNPLAIADRNGAVHFLFCLDYGRVFYMSSKDDGQTFSTPVEISSVFEKLKPQYAWRVIATGPGHGIQLKNGRLLAPVWLALGTTGNGHGPSVNTTVYSDDHGKSWHAGEIAIPNTPEFPSANETNIAQLANGSVMMNVRTASDAHRRTITISKDGATKWSTPHMQQDLIDPRCFASLVRLSTKKSGGKDRLLFSNPDDEKSRKNLTVRVSYDEGQSWTVKRSLSPGAGAYSDLAVLPNGAILCFYETANQSGARVITLARFNLEWLTDGKDSMRKLGK